MRRHRFVSHRARTKGARPKVAVLSALAMVVSTATVAVTFHVGAAGAVDLAPPIDLSNPTATVHDPAAGLVPVNTNCTGTQVDLNTASASELSQALGLPSDPTISRLIAMRPWLKGSDLSSVPGIGPSTAAIIAPKTCATQPGPTTAQPRACLSASQIDLNAASASTIQSKLGLPGVTANALVAARPLPQNLSQVTTPRVPGFPQPTVDTLTRQGRICVTPAPYISGNTLYRWISPGGGATIRTEGYGLIVPPGRVTQPGGAYGSVTPEPDPTDGTPYADNHIWGAWNSPATTVAIEEPYIGDGTTVPVAMHDSGDGPRLTTGTNAATETVDGAPTQVTLQTSLSGTLGGAVNCDGTLDYSPTPTSQLCANNFLDIVEQNDFTNRLQGEARKTVAVQQQPCPQSKTSTALAFSDGDLPTGIECTLTRDGSGVQWHFRNTTALNLAWGFAEEEVVYDFTVSTTDWTVTGSADTDPVASELAKAFNKAGKLFGDQTLTVNEPLDAPPITVNIVSNPNLSGAWAAIKDALKATSGPIRAWWNIAQNGHQLVADCHSATDAVACIKTIGEIATGQIPLSCKPAGLYTSCPWLSENQRTGIKAVGGWLDRLGTVLVAGTAVGSYLGGWTVKIINDGTDVHLYNITTFSPPGTGGPGPEFPDYIARNPYTHKSVLVEGGHVYSIDDGGMFLCLAKTRVVWDVANQAVLYQTSDGSATCAPSSQHPQPWDYKASADGGNIPNNVILREDPADAGSNPLASWLINNQGEIQSIPSQPTYICLAYTNPVIWNTPFADVQAWKQVGTSEANCGG